MISFFVSCQCLEKGSQKEGRVLQVKHLTSFCACGIVVVALKVCTTSPGNFKSFHFPKHRNVQSLWSLAGTSKHSPKPPKPSQDAPRFWAWRGMLGIRALVQLFQH